MLFTTAVNHKTFRKVSWTQDASILTGSMEGRPEGGPCRDSCGAESFPAKSLRKGQVLEGAKLLLGWGAIIKTMCPAACLAIKNRVVCDFKCCKRG